jgi:hypothetical protein
MQGLEVLKEPANSGPQSSFLNCLQTQGRIKKHEERRSERRGPFKWSVLNRDQ